VISGRLYKPLDTAVPQQFFATSMVLTPLVRGLLGLDVDAPARRLTIAPHLPPDWDSVRVENVPVGGDRIDIAIRRGGGRISADLTRHARAGTTPMPLDVVFSPALPLGATTDAPTEATPGDVHATVRGTLDTTLTLGIAFAGGWTIAPPLMRPAIGDRSKAPRIISERLAGGRYVVSLEGLAGRTYRFRVAGPAAGFTASAGAGGSIAIRAASPGAPREVDITFPRSAANSDGYTALIATFGAAR